MQISEVVTERLVERTPRTPLFLVLVLFVIALVMTFFTLRSTLPVTGWSGFFSAPDSSNLRWVVIRYSYFPRVAVALVSGAALALAGTLFQHVLRNPLAEPTTLGVAAGASLGMSICTIWFPSVLLIGREWTAMAGAGAACALVFAIAWSQTLSPVTLILAGLVVTLCSGAVGGLLATIYGEGLSGVFLWQSGVLNQNSWNNVWYLAPRVFAATVVTALLARPLAVLAVGDDVTQSLGVSLRWIRSLALVLATALTAFVVSVAGVIGFVGLAGPALAGVTGARTLGARLIWAPLIGACLLWMADQLVQLVAAFMPGIPTGVATALLGAPLLLWLLPRLKDEPRAPGNESIGHDQRPRPTWLVLGLSIIVLVVCMGIAFLLNSGMSGWHLESAQALKLLFRLRVPRVGGAAAAGALLATSGILMQRMTANTLASPEVLGISAGASLGLILLLLLVPVTNELSQLCASALGAFIALSGMFLLARRSGFSPGRLVLTGIAISTVFGAFASLMMASGDPRMSVLQAWMSGSTYRVGMPQALAGLGIMVLMVPLVTLSARPLSILPFGDGVARSLGVDVPRDRLILLLCTSVMTGAATLIIGPVSFVGLMAPHIARMLGLRAVIPQIIGGAAIGASMLVLADWIGRNFLFPYQIPAGLIVSLVGGPYFLALLWRSGTRHD